MYAYECVRVCLFTNIFLFSYHKTVSFFIIYNYCNLGICGVIIYITIGLRLLFINFWKSSILIKSLKEYQSIQKSYKSIENQVFILVILFWVKKGFYENESLGFDLFLINTLLDFKKYEGFVSLDTFFSFEKALHRGRSRLHPLMQVLKSHL